MVMPDAKVITAEPPSETVRESWGDLNQSELVLEWRSWVFFGRQITGAYGPSGELTGCFSSAR